MKFGVYVRNILLNRHGTPQGLAGDIVSMGLSGVLVQAAWHDERGKKETNGQRIFDYLAAMLEQKLSVGIWGYPDPKTDLDFIDRLRDVARDMMLRHQPLHEICLDVEAPYQGRKAAWRRLVKECDEHLTKLVAPLTLTSFGSINLHPKMPFAAGAMGPLSICRPQFYTAEDPLPGLKKWAKIGFDTCGPSIPAFGPNSGKKLFDYVNKIVDGVHAHGMALAEMHLWSYEHIMSRLKSADTRAVIGRLASR